MAKMPKKIKIGAFTYSVVLWNREWASDVNRWGECDIENLIIRIKEELPVSRKAEVLLHEVLHGAFHNSGLREVTSFTEELIVNSMSMQLHQVIQDNPELVAYLENPE